MDRLLVMLGPLSLMGIGGSKLAILLTVPETLNRNKYPLFETS